MPKTSMVLLFVLMAGCADPADPDFQRCQNLEAEANFEGALEACKLAVSKSAESSSGKKAAAKIDSLSRAIEVARLDEMLRELEAERDADDSMTEAEREARIEKLQKEKQRAAGAASD